MPSEQVIITIVSNSVVAALIIYIFNIYKKRIEDNSKANVETNVKVDEIVDNYLSKFQEIQTLITKNDKEIMRELSEVKTEVKVMQAKFELIQQSQ